MNTTSPSLQRVGGSFAPSLLSFSLESFCKFLQVLAINLFKWILYFHYSYPGLRDDKYGILLIAKSEGKLCIVIVEFFTWEFLQVCASTRSGGFYILPLDLDFQHHWHCSRVLTSSYKFLHQFVHLWLLTSVLFDNLALTFIVVVMWKLLQVLALTIDWKAIASLASSTSFILMKCKCFQPLSWVLLRALIVNCILYLLITFKLSTTFCKCFVSIIVFHLNMSCSWGVVV